MSREARRVPLGFDWPLNEVWEGYLMPDHLRAQDCTDCSGRGSTTARQWVEASAAMILLLADDLRAQERGRPMHPYFAEYYTSAHGTRPSSDIVELTAGLAGRKPGFIGHDALDRWSATSKIIAAAGLDPETWGLCQTCAGHGLTEKYPGQRAEAEAWEPTDPPTGDGWQMWETTSEGSPVTPVFATDEELADHCAAHVSFFGGIPAGRDQWLKVIRGEDFAHVQIAPGVVMM